MRRCDDICAFTVLLFVFSCCEKSLKTLPLCCLFRGKVRLKKNCTKKELFSLRDDYEYREEYTEEEEEEEREKRRRERDRSLLLRKRSG